MWSVKPPIGKRPFFSTAERQKLGWLVAISVAQVVTTVWFAFTVSALVANAAESRDASFLDLVTLMLLVAAVTWLRYAERLVGEQFGQVVAHRIRRRLGRHLLATSLETGGRSNGGILLRCTSDLNALHKWYSRGLVTLIVGLPVTCATVAALAMLDYRLSLVVIAVLALAVVQQVVVLPRFKQASITARRARGRLATAITERADAVGSIQVFGATGREARHIDRRSRTLVRAMIVRARWSGILRASSEWVAMGIPLFILMVWVYAGDVAVGAGASALTVAGLLAPRVRQFGLVFEYYALAAVSRYKINQFLARPTLDTRSNARGLSHGNGQLKLRKLSLQGVFHDLEARAPAGARVALTGPNGSGKSRLLRLIAGMEEPTSGAIVLGRHNTTIRRLRSLRKKVAIAGPDTPLLSGSVISNIHYGQRLHDKEATRMMKIAGYDELIASLPNGGETRVGRGGKTLSQGQQQRIKLIRALMRRPAVLLLDEVEANMDESGDGVLQRIFEAYEGTIIMVTHTDNWINRCNTRWHLEEKSLTEYEQSSTMPGIANVS